MSRHRARKAVLLQLGPDLTPTRALKLESYNRGHGPQPVVCQRVADGPPAVPSKQGTCDTCLARVWLAPSTLTLLPQMRAPEIMCMHCCLDRLKQEEH